MKLQAQVRVPCKSAHVSENYSQEQGNCSQADNLRDPVEPFECAFARSRSSDFVHGSAREMKRRR